MKKQFFSKKVRILLIAAVVLAVFIAVVSTFSGSGTTIIACEQLERVCYAMEKSPEYCDLAVKRWEQFTGQKAERVTQHGTES